MQAKAIPIPGILGVLVGLAFGWFVFRIGKEASLKKLLVASTIILLFIAGELRKICESRRWSAPFVRQTNTSNT